MNGEIIGWFSVALLTFVGTLVALPFLVIRIPEDYFLRPRHTFDPQRGQHPAVRLTLVVLKNALGIVLVLAGIAMLVLPGQGILTILIGVTLLDFPGKYALERWIVRRPHVLRAINWIRQKAGRPPLIAPPREGGPRRLEQPPQI